MAELLKEYEGTWEEVLTHSDELAGQTVHLTVVEPKKELPLANQKMLALIEEMQKNPWTEEELKVFDFIENSLREERIRFYGDEGKI